MTNNKCSLHTERIATLEESIKSAHHRIREFDEKLTRLEAKVDNLETTTAKLEAVLTRLESAVDNLAKSLERAKWYLLTGILGPLIVALILAYIDN